MSGTKIAGIVLVLAGILALIYGGFSYTRETHDAKIGPIEFSVSDTDRVNIPIWAGVGAVVIGAGALLVPFKRT